MMRTKCLQTVAISRRSRSAVSVVSGAESRTPINQIRVISPHVERIKSNTVALFCRESIPVVANKVVCRQDVCLLFGHQLANRQREILRKNVCIGLFCLVFPLFSSLQQSVITAAQSGFDVSPRALQCADRRAGFLDIMHAVLVKNLFEIAPEAGSFQRFGEKVAFQGLVLQMFANLGKTFLAIEKGADEGVESKLHFVLSACVCRHLCPNL